MSDDRALEAAAEALIAHEVAFQKGQGRAVLFSTHVRGPDREAAQQCVAAYLDCLLDGLPEEAVEAAQAHEKRGKGRDRVTVIDTEQSVRRFLLSLRGSLNPEGDG